MEKSSQPVEYDVAIVGGGMVGASLACALAQTNLRVVLLDGVQFDPARTPFESEEQAFDPRVSAISPASQQWLERIGAWKEIAATRLCPYKEMLVWDADGTGSIQFCAQDIHAQRLGHIIENSIVLSGIYKTLAGLPQISIKAPYRVENIARVIDSDGERLHITTQEGFSCVATLVVGADGPNSIIRQLAGFEVKEWDYRHHAIVTTVRTELPHQSRALQRFMDSGPLAFLPLCQSRQTGKEKGGFEIPNSEEGDSAQPDRLSAAQNYCSIVWSVVPARSEQLLAMNDTDFALALGNAIEHKLGKIETVDKRLWFPLKQSHAVDYVKENIVLIGDAAHTIHPLAGQGVNLGFMDAQALFEELASGLERRRPLDEFAILRRYQRRRIGYNLGMMWLMEGFKFLFAQQALPLRWLRNAGMSGIDRVSAVKTRLMRQAMGIDD